MLQGRLNTINQINLQRGYQRINQTEFIGYKRRICSGSKLIVRDNNLVTEAKEGEEVELFFLKTPFYAEKGGQVADKGIIFSNLFESEVVDVQFVSEKVISHFVKIKRGNIKVGDEVTLKVDESRRKAIEKNHTATHLIHAALRKVIGNHVKQAGSYVGPERLRFDFTHFESLREDEIVEIECLVNEQIQKLYQ